MFLLRSAGPSRIACRAFASSATHSSSPSHAYTIPATPGPQAPLPPRTPATSERPDLSPEQQSVIDKIVRVDQAGELGANWIYRGQKFGSALRGDRKTVKEVEAMWSTEKHHLETMKLLQTQHRVRPTLLWPVWQGMAFGLGAVTALMGREAAMACTEAVETVIGEHYDDQLKAIKPVLENSSHPSLPLLASILEEFRDDELEHLDHAVEGGAQKAPGHSLLSAVIGAGCKVAIKVCEKV